MFSLGHFCHGFQPRHDVHTQRLPLLSSMDTTRSSSLRTTALQCREPYVPSWAQRDSSKHNVYEEQRAEYEEYAKYLNARDAGASCKEPVGTPPAPSLEDALRAALTPVHHLAVTDVTDGHAVEGVLDGRALRADGREILVLVVSARFYGQETYLVAGLGLG